MSLRRISTRRPSWWAGDLGIDSIDVLELVMLVEKEYGVVIDSKELGAQVFASLGALGAYIQKVQKEGGAVG